MLLRARALLRRERPGDALNEARRAVELAPGSLPAWHELAGTAYRSAEFGEALAALETLVKLSPDAAGTWHRLGRAAWWTGDRARATEAFSRAAALEPDSFVVPVRVAPVEFQRLAVEVWRSIPDMFRAQLSNTQSLVEELPDREDVAGGLDPDILGLYEGGTALAEGDWYERILLFQRNHEAVCAGLGELREEVRRTVLHEVGHHFGMDHDELPY